MTVQCACRFLGASRLAGAPAGYRWDCGILQARLNQDVPVDLNSYPYPLLDGLYLDGTFPRIATDRRAFGWRPGGGVTGLAGGGAGNPCATRAPGKAFNRRVREMLERSAGRTAGRILSG